MQRVQLYFVLQLLWLCVTLHPTVDAGVVLYTNVFGRINVPASAIWDGGLNLTMVGDSNCRWTAISPREIFRFGITATSTSTPHRWSPPYVDSIFTLTNTYGVANPTGPFNPTARSNVSAVLRPAPGFVLRAPVILEYVNPLDENRSLSNCTRGTGGSLAIASNSNGGLASMILNVTHEYDVQRSGLQIVITLQYNVFVSVPSPQVACTGSSACSDLVSGWSWSLSNEYTVVGIRNSLPGFDLPAGATATLSVTISPSASLFITVSPPTPNTASFTINAVDGNPLAFCVLSVPNITDRAIRSPAGGVVDITLSPAANDDFVVYNATTMAASQWIGTVSTNQLASLAVSVAYATPNARRARLTFTASNIFYLDSPVALVFSPPPNVLGSQTAGCGTLNLLLVPASANVSARPDDATNITEVSINERSKIIMFDIRFAKFRLQQSVPVTFVSDYSGRIATSLETPFAEALALDNVVIEATANSESSATVVIPRLPSYNIDVRRTECITIYFLGGAVASGVPPYTDTVPTFCMSGVDSNITATFRSTGANWTRAVTLWDDGDVLQLNLSAAKWNTSAVWTPFAPVVRSSSGALDVLLGYSPINFTNITFSPNNRTAYLRFIPCVGLSVSAAEIGSVEHFHSLLDSNASVSAANTAFAVAQPTSDNVTFTCTGHCTTNDADQSRAASEDDVRMGRLSFTVSSVYDALVDEASLRALGWSIFTRNASSIVRLAPLPTMTVRRTSNTTAQYNFTADANFDITSADLAVLFVNTSFLRNRIVKPNTRGFIVFNVSAQPTCVLSSFRPAMSEVSIQNSNVTFFLFVNGSTIKSTVCSELQNRARNLSYTVLSSFPLLVTVGNCSLANASHLPLILYSNNSYEISSADIVTMMFDQSYFVQKHRCAVDPSVSVPVLPAVAVFSFSYEDSRAVNQSSIRVPLLPSLRDSNGNTLPSAAVIVPERVFRSFGLHIQIHFSGEKVSACHFMLPYRAHVADKTRSASNFESVVGERSVNMTADSNCTVNVSTVVSFRGVIPPRYGYDVATNENISFFVNGSVGSGLVEPTAVNSTVIFEAQSEDLLGVLTTGKGQRLSMRPLPNAAPYPNTSTERDLSFLSPLNVSLPLTGVNASWSYVEATSTCEEMALGGQVYTLALTGDRWLPGAAQLIVSSILVLSRENRTTVPPGTLPPSMLNLLFPAGQSSVACAPSSRVCSITIPAPQVPSFYCMQDLLLAFNIPTLAVDSEIVTSPAWVGLSLVSGPPTLVPSGPAYRGGTRRLLLGQLFLIIYLENDNFIPSSISAPTVCPKTFDTCSVTIDSTLRYMNISFPPQDLVLYSTTFYDINITADNVVSHRPINNTVQFSLAVESGILDSIAVGAQTVVSGETKISELFWRTGAIEFITFILRGDSFVTSTRDILIALRQQISCSPPSDAFGFCSRVAQMLVGHRSLTADPTKSQQIQVLLQADDLFDVYREERVYLGFGGVATTSTFSPIFLRDLSFVITPSNGSLTMTTTHPSSTAAPLSAQSLRDGSAGTVLWTFTVAGERWNIGSAFPSLTTPSGDSIRQLLLDAFSGSGMCDTCFNKRKDFLFASDATVSSDSRVLRIRMVTDTQYDTPTTETITIQFRNELLFLSGILPSHTTLASTDWGMVIVPSGVRLSLSSVVPQPLSVSTNNTHLAAISVAAHVLQSTGTNITVRLAPNSSYFWNMSIILRPVNVALFATSYAISDKSLAAEPNGFLSRRDEMIRLAAPSGADAADGGSSITVCLMPSAAYRLQNSAGEQIKITMPSMWVKKSSDSQASSPSLSPSTILVAVAVRKALVVVVVRKPTSATPCTQIVTATRLVSNLTGFLHTSAQTMSVESVTTVPLSGQHCNVSVALLTTEAVNARDLQGVLLRASVAELTACCLVSFVYDPDSPPTDAEMRSALAVAPAPTPESQNVGQQLTWVLSAIGVLLLVLVLIILYRRRAQGADFAGATRSSVDTSSKAELWSMKLLVEDNISEEELRRRRRIAEARKRARIHEDDEGAPSFSQAPPSGEIAIHDSVFAGQPNSGVQSAYRRGGSNTSGVRIQPVDVPLLEDEYDIPIAPTSVDGVMLHHFRQSHGNSAFDDDHSISSGSESDTSDGNSKEQNASALDSKHVARSRYYKRMPRAGTHFATGSDVALERRVRFELL